MSSKVDSKKFNPPPKYPKKEQNPELLHFDSLESEYEHFKNAYDKIKDTKDSPPIHDKYIILNAISMLEDPKEIARELKKSPDKIFHDPLYQAVIWCLRNLCKREQNENHKWAKKLLRDMGLAIFIPDVPKRITDHAYLLHYQKNPDKLENDVEKYLQMIKNHINSDKLIHNNEEELEVLFKETFGVDPPEELIDGEYTLQVKTIALYFLSFEIQAPYEALKRIYYSNKK